MSIFIKVSFYQGFILSRFHFIKVFVMLRKDFYFNILQHRFSINSIILRLVCFVIIVSSVLLT